MLPTTVLIPNKANSLGELLVLVEHRLPAADEVISTTEGAGKLILLQSIANDAYATFGTVEVSLFQSMVY